jgi:translation elongation factor EF-4
MFPPCLVFRTSLTNCYSKGYATLDYEDAGWQQSSLVKIQLLVNRQPVDAICKVVHTSQVDRLGKQWVTKFKEHVDRQHFGKSSPTHIALMLFFR